VDPAKRTFKSNPLEVQMILTFDQWMERVDQVCQLDFGLSIHELPDMLFRDAYDSGIGPEEFMSENLPDAEALGQVILS